MAVSTNPQMNAFADQYYRPLADAFEIFLQKCLAFQAAYLANGIAALATTDASNDLGNNVPSDGRPLVTGTNLINFNASVNQIVTAMNATSVGGVGTTAKAQADIAQVNGLLAT